MATEPSKWNVAPGANADCNDIPDVADADSGLASWSALFPQLTALPLSAGGRAPKREDFNGLLRAFGQRFRVTAACERYWQGVKTSVDGLLKVVS